MTLDYDDGAKTLETGGALTRYSLPARALAYSPGDGRLLAIGAEEPGVRVFLQAPRPGGASSA